MFNIGDRVTINPHYDAYIECNCNYCEALRDGGEGIVRGAFPQSLRVKVITKDGADIGDYSFNNEGMILLHNKGVPDWEV